MTDTNLNDLVSCNKCGVVHEASLTKKIRKDYSNHWMCKACGEENWIIEY